MGEQSCWHPVLPDSAPPPRRALRPDAPVVCPGFGFDKFGLHNISLVRASGKTFRRRVYIALETTRDACLLGELFCPTPPRRPTVHPDPTRPLYVRVLDSTSFVCLRFCVGSPTVFSRELCGASTAIGHTSKFIFLTLGRPSWTNLLWVKSALPARGSA